MVFACSAGHEWATLGLSTIAPATGSESTASRRLHMPQLGSRLPCCYSADVGPPRRKQQHASLAGSTAPLSWTAQHRRAGLPVSPDLRWLRCQLSGRQLSFSSEARGDAASTSEARPSTAGGETTVLAAASMRIAPGTMVHVEAPHWDQTNGHASSAADDHAAGPRTDIDVQTGADAETVSVQVTGSTAELTLREQYWLLREAIGSPLAQRVDR